MGRMLRFAGLLFLGVWLLSSGCKTVEVDDRKPSEARMLVESGAATLLDVRTVQEYREGHVSGAVNIPVQVLQGRLNELSKDKPVIVYCASGRRSAMAKRMLDAQGFVRVIDVGPMPDWSK